MFTKLKKKIQNAVKTRRNSTIYINSGGGYVWQDRNYNNFSDGGYIANVIANYAANTLARAISSIPLYLYRYGREKQQLIQHRILSLMRKPNPFTSGHNLIEQLALHMIISGNAYLLRITDAHDRISELHLLRPDRMAIVTDDGIIKGYQYKINNSTKDYAIDPNTGDCDVLHIKTFHPTNDIYGLSRFEPAHYSIEQHNQACIWTHSLLKNSARPSGALIVKSDENSRLTETERAEIKDQLDKLFSGYYNPGRPILLEGGLEWKEMSINPKDMDFVNAKNNMARDIMLAFGLPPYLLGIPGDNTYSNLSEATTFFYENSVLPMLLSILSSINNWFEYSFPSEDLRLEYNMADIRVFTDQQLAKWKHLDAVAYLTVNEKRHMSGLSPIPGGDEL